MSMTLDLSGLEDKWRSESPQHPPCAACGKTIGDEAHAEICADEDYCPDHASHEIALRIWKGKDQDTKEMAFHVKCAEPRMRTEEIEAMRTAYARCPKCEHHWPRDYMKPLCPLCRAPVRVGDTVKITQCASSTDHGRHGSHHGILEGMDAAVRIGVSGDPPLEDSLALVYTVTVPDSTFLDKRVYALQVEKVAP